MSYGIVRVQKMSRGSVKGIEIHDRREKEGVSHTNSDIDWERSGLNYDLCPAQNESFLRAVRQRIEELQLPRAVRKDAVVMAQVLVTSDNDFFRGLPPEKMRAFFRDAYDFLADRYGKENVVSATVHMDEQTPHMHFNFVPVTRDGRLSAKTLLTRQSLIEQQTAFHEQVGARYGLERGVQGGKKRHLETQDYKAEKAAQKALEAAEAVKREESRLNALKTDIGRLQAEYKAKQAYVREADRISSVSVMYPPEVKVKKGHLGQEDTVVVPKHIWEAKHVSANEKSYLRSTTEELNRELAQLRRQPAAQDIARLSRELEEMRRTLDAEHFKNLQVNSKLEQAERESAALIGKLNRVLDKLPENVRELFLQEWHEQERHRSMEMER